MQDDEIQMLFDTSYRLVDTVSVGFKRYLFENINWDERLLCVKGPKGTGKTTLIL